MLTASCTCSARFSAAAREESGAKVPSSSAVGSPGRRSFACSVSRATKPSKTSSMTIIRLLELQAWPVLLIRVSQAVSAAAVDVVGVEDDVGVGAAELEHALLEVLAGDRRRRRHRRAPSRSARRPAIRGSAMIVSIWSCEAKTLT